VNQSKAQILAAKNKAAAKANVARYSKQYAAQCKTPAAKKTPACKTLAAKLAASQKAAK
jgi:hypothetical protein